jgi:hypothetical protein
MEKLISRQTRGQFLEILVEYVIKLQFLKKIIVFNVRNSNQRT